MRRARALKGAFTWSGERERSQSSKDERSFYAHAADHGIRSGVTIPNQSRAWHPCHTLSMATHLSR
ncbi:autoinducer binding domain-containing protein [Sinorhizobium meliloti]|nr:autoinducer binding domain-containing protein [Sinorhizobium meliloti]